MITSTVAHTFLLMALTTNTLPSHQFKTRQRGHFIICVVRLQ